MIKRLVIILAFLLALAGLLWFGFFRSAPSQNSAPDFSQATSVLVTKAKQKDQPILLEGVGTVKAYQRVDVVPQVEGQLEQLNFSEGQAVEQGQILAQIDPSLYQADRDEAAGQLAADQANLKRAQADLERFSQLAEQNFISAQQVDKARAEVGQYKAQISSDRAKIARAQKKLSYTKIKAPISGIAGLRQVDVGNIVHANSDSTIVTLTQVDPIAVEFTLPAKELPQIMLARSAGPLSVHVFDARGQNQLASGAIEAINNEIDDETGTIKLKARLANEDHSLWPGQFVNVKLKVGVHEKATIIPLAALQQGPNGSFVYGINADLKAQMHPVTVLQQDEHIAVIGKGIKPGDTVISAGFAGLTNGSRVKIDLSDSRDDTR